MGFLLCGKSELSWEEQLGVEWQLQGVCREQGTLGAELRGLTWPWEWRSMYKKERMERECRIC